MKKLALTSLAALVAALGVSGGALAAGTTLVPKPPAKCPSPFATASGLPCKILR